MPIAAIDKSCAASAPPPLQIRELAVVGYMPAWRAMQRYTRLRAEASPDCIWLLQHPPTITLGMRGRPSDALRPSGCAVIRTDRGGQATYHGPGQLVGYLMLNLRRAGMGARQLVQVTERMLCELLAQYGLAPELLCGKPGVYLQGQKIASLGFRISRHYSYHGFSLNVDCDLAPFADIVTCGTAGQPMTRLSAHVPGINIPSLLPRLQPLLRRYFGHTGAERAR